MCSSTLAVHDWGLVYICFRRLEEMNSICVAVGKLLALLDKDFWVPPFYGRSTHIPAGNSSSMLCDEAQ